MSANSLRKLKDNEIINSFLQHIKNENKDLAFNKDRQEFYLYKIPIWIAIDSNKLGRLIVEFYKVNLEDYSNAKIQNLINLMKLELPIMKSSARDDFIEFNNGIVNIYSKKTEPHKKNNYLTSIIPYNYEIHPSQMPYFEQWLQDVSSGNNEIIKVIKAILYMVLTTQEKWHLFVEITGKAGTGKSIFSSICELLVGKDNASHISLSNMEKNRFNLLLANKKLLIANDEGNFKGETPILKKITGGDSITIESKYKDAINYEIKAIFIMTNNRPANFLGDVGIARRRILLEFNNVIPEYKKDIHLLEKIEKEIGSVASMLLNTFPYPDVARHILMRYKQSEISQDIQGNLNSLYKFSQSLYLSESCNGLYMGSKKIKSDKDKNQCLYLLYEVFCDYYEIDNLNISSNTFSERLRSTFAAIYPELEFKKQSKNNKVITNAHLKKDSEFYNYLITANIN